MLRLRPMVRHGKLITAAYFQPDWTGKPPCGQRTDRGVLGQRQLRAEMAADKMRDDPHLVRSQSELRRQPMLHGADVPRRFEHRQPITLPHARGAWQLDRVVVLDRRRIAGIDPRRRIGERSFQIALPSIFVLGIDIGQRLRRASRVGKRGHRWLARIAETQRGRCGGCRLGRLGDH